MESRTLATNDDTRDLAIQLTDKLVEMSVVPDCIDSEEGNEFEAQDAMHEIINTFLGIEEN